jgi:monovalent cation:H+ antiporter-2, CPA2 family
MREAETIVWLMVFEDIVLVLLIVFLSAGVSVPLITLLQIAGMAVLFFGIAAWGRDLILRVLDRDDEIPVLITFSAVICTALFSQFLGIPDTLMVIVLGSALSTTTPRTLERNARPFKDVFLVMFFVFFGISVDFSGNIGLLPIAALSVLAVMSKCISGIIIGIRVHGTTESGIEIWANTIARGEFSIALAALYGSAMVSSTIAAMVIVTSIAGSAAAKISPVLKRVVYWHSRLSLSGSVSLKW